jgi:hypothetical protein
LYPDPLLAEVLMASTYPLEVVRAERWLSDDKNKKLSGDHLKSAVDKQPWDQSVRSLVPTPSVLAMMSQNLDWTQKLGDAVLAQQSDVMDAVQRLRAKAQAGNKLTTTKEQIVTVTQGGDNKQTIIIEPASPDTVYVPYYEPSVVYGDWSYPSYPAYYFPPAPGYIATGIIAGGIAFGAGYALGRWASGGNYWGGGVNWNRGDINVNRPVTINNIGNNVGNNVGNKWQHNPEHRQGVGYSNANVQQKFGNNNNERARIRTPGNGTAVDHRNQSGNRQGSGDRSTSGANRPQVSASGKGGESAGKGAKNVGKGAKSVGKDAKSGGKNAKSTGTGAKNAGKNAKSTGTGAKNVGKDVKSAGTGAKSAASKGTKSTNVQRGPTQASRTHHSSGQKANVGGGRGGGGGGGRGGGRRSDIAPKHDVALIGGIENGLGFYRLGLAEQKAHALVPSTVVRGSA